MPAIFAIRTVVVSGGACCANTFGLPIRLTPAADESVASKRRRLCLDCISAFSLLLGFCPMRLSDDATVLCAFRVTLLLGSPSCAMEGNATL